MDPIWKGVLDWGQGTEKAFLSYITEEHHLERMTVNLTSMNDSFEILLKTSWEGDNRVISGPDEIHAVGHRVVHGGSRFTLPTRMTDEVKSKIHKLERLAPLHNPSNLKGIDVIESILPGIPQYAVFDTTYHTTIGEAVATYPIPQEWREQGIKRYGFHGISHQYCVERTANLLSSPLETQKIVTCHLGNGSSLAATQEGTCVDTTMGFTPLDGLMMGTRSGAIDPGIIIHLLREGNISLLDLEKALYTKSGLLGICGFSDMRYLLEEILQGNETAKLAFDMYLHSLKSYIGSMAATMDGMDVLVFTAGVGEHAHYVRQVACEGLSHLGISIDNNLNFNCSPDQDIATKDSRVRVMVIHTREEYAIAKAVDQLQNANANRHS